MKQRVEDKRKTRKNGRGDKRRSDSNSLHKPYDSPTTVSSLSPHTAMPLHSLAFNDPKTNRAVE